MPTKYQLSHNDRTVVFENRLQSESPMLYRPALHGNSNALSLARRALKDKFPTPKVPLITVLQNHQVFLPKPELNPLKPELNPICYLLALLGVHHFLHVSRIRVKLLTFRVLMSYIYGAPILDVSRSHTMTQHSR